MPIWYTFYTFICLREQIFKNSLAREASFQEALALAERREVEKKGSILPLPHQAYLLIEKIGTVYHHLDLMTYLADFIKVAFLEGAHKQVPGGTSSLLTQ